MPKIKLRGRSNANQNVPRAQLRNPAFAGQDAAQIAQLGKTLQGAGQSIFNTTQSIRASDAKTKLAEIRNGEGGLVSSLNEYKSNEQKKDLLGYGDRVSEFISKRKEEEIRKAGDNSFLAKEIEREFSQLGNLEREKALAFERSELLKAGKARLDRVQEGLVKDVLGSGDPDVLVTKIAEAHGQAAEQAGILFSADELETRHQQIEDTFTKAYIQGAVNKGDFASARKTAQENDDELFGSALAKQKIIRDINRKEERAQEIADKKERKQHSANKKKLAIIKENFKASLDVLELNDADSFEEFNTRIDKARESGLISQRDYVGYKNLGLKKVKDGVEEVVIDNIIDGDLQSAREYLIANREIIPAKLYRSLYKQANPGQGANGRTKLTTLDKQAKKHFLSDLREEFSPTKFDPISGRLGKGSPDPEFYEAISTYEGFVGKHGHRSAILMAKVRHGLLDGSPAAIWERTFSEGEEPLEYNEPNISLRIRDLTVKSLTAQGREKRTLESLVDQLNVERQKLVEFKKAKTLLDSYSTSENLRNK